MIWFVAGLLVYAGLTEIRYYWLGIDLRAAFKRNKEIRAEHTRAIGAHNDAIKDLCVCIEQDRERLAALEALRG